MQGIYFVGKGHSHSIGYGMSRDVGIHLSVTVSYDSDVSLECCVGNVNNSMLRLRMLQ